MGRPVAFDSDGLGTAVERVPYMPYITKQETLQSGRREEVMKVTRLTMFLVVAGMLVLLAGQSAFGAIKIVKFTVPSCE
jgi:hypothetical protein